MRIPRFSCFCLGLTLLLSPGASHAAATDYTLEITSQGDNTYTLTRWAKTGFDRNLDKLKEHALADATDYCAQQHRALKVISTTAHRPFIPTTGFAYAKVVFQALDPNAPALQAPVAVRAAAQAAPSSSPPKTATDALYDDLTKLEDLRRRGILTDDEFQTVKQRLIDQTQAHQ